MYYHLDIAQATMDFEKSKLVIDSVAEICHQFLFEEFDRSSKVCYFEQPHELRYKLKKLLQVNDRHALDIPELLRETELVLRHCVRTGHPMFMNQVTNGIDFCSLLGEWVAATVNSNMLVTIF